MFFNAYIFQLKPSSKDKTDKDILRENHQFLWEEDDEEEEKIKNNWYASLLEIEIEYKWVKCMNDQIH